MKLPPQNSHFKELSWESVVFLFDCLGSACNCFSLTGLMKICLITLDPHCCRSWGSTESLDTKYLERRETQTEVNQCSFLAASFVALTRPYVIREICTGMISWTLARLYGSWVVNKAPHLWFPVFSLLRSHLPFIFSSISYYTLKQWLFANEHCRLLYYLYLQSCLHVLVAYNSQLQNTIYILCFLNTNIVFVLCLLIKCGRLNNANYINNHTIFSFLLSA